MHTNAITLNYISKRIILVYIRFQSSWCKVKNQSNIISQAKCQVSRVCSSVSYSRCQRAPGDTSLAGTASKNLSEIEANSIPVKDLRFAITIGKIKWNKKDTVESDRFYSCLFFIFTLGKSAFSSSSSSSFSSLLLMTRKRRRRRNER